MGKIKINLRNPNNWKSHLYRVGTKKAEFDNEPPEPEKYRKDIEPWLSAVFQSEHLSLLLGSGFTLGIASAAGTKGTEMGIVNIDHSLKEHINKYAAEIAKQSSRIEYNIEDQISAIIQLKTGLSIQGDPRANELKSVLDHILSTFVNSVLETEKSIHATIKAGEELGNYVQKVVISFLLSFASRASSRERLNLFTTNYDRLVEYGCDLIGLRVIDRFVGTLSPLFRSSRLEVDLHYNPPGIRGEPRYLEGVIKFCKLHGSIDWRYEQDAIRRYAIPFGSPPNHPDLTKEPLDSMMIYPNPAKEIETLYYPYSELFRDYSASLCRPNSVLITYGYGFGDDHINRVIQDMLTIPSTHLVIISWNDKLNRIQKFCSKVGHDVQISLLIGNHFGNIPTLVEHYLPKPAIDQITWRKAELLKKRGTIPTTESDSSGGEV